MNRAAIVIAAVAGVGTTIAAVRHISVKQQAFNYACNLVSEKGIINLGAGPHRTLLAQEIAASSEVVVNVDFVPDGLPNFIELDIDNEALPFADKQFDCSFMSHILEHLYNWEFALNEAIRVADSVVVVLPHPLSIAGWLHPDHKQHFGFRDIEVIQEIFPTVRVFY